MSYGMRPVRSRVLAAALALIMARSVQAKEAPARAEERIHRIESTVVSIPLGGGEAPLRLDLPALMQTLRIPGLSVAVIDGFKVVWAKGYGVLEAG